MFEGNNRQRGWRSKMTCCIFHSSDAVKIRFQRRGCREQQRRQPSVARISSAERRHVTVSNIVKNADHPSTILPLCRRCSFTGSWKSNLLLSKIFLESTLNFRVRFQELDLFGESRTLRLARENNVAYDHLSIAVVSRSCLLGISWYNLTWRRTNGSVCFEESCSNGHNRISSTDGA